MNRANYYNYIEERLTTLRYRVEMRGSLNILDYHIHAEDLYRDLLNILFDWNLINLNTLEQNAAAIDLVDTRRKLVVQVSATATKKKIESSLDNDFSKYKGFQFKFIFIAKSAKYLRNQNYSTPKGISFNPTNDIIDVQSLLLEIKNSSIENHKIIYDFIKAELGTDSGINNTESNLTSIINLLSQGELRENEKDYESIAFEIENKINYNELSSTKYIIEEYAVYSSHIDKIYKEFDQQGKNKSRSVLSSIRAIYADNLDKLQGDKLFLQIVTAIVDRVTESCNYEDIPFEELEMCASIVATDTFVRCKIFENPVNYQHVVSR